MPDDLYAGFAERYDRFFERPVGQHDPAMQAFFARLVERHGIRRVLDCACGTGRDLLLLASLGCEAVGSDVSPAMLEVARRNLIYQAGPVIPLVQADYRELEAHFGAGPPFDAVLCLSTAISHMPDEDQVVLAFSSMLGVLRPGGVLVLSQGTADKMWNARPRFLLVRDTPEFTRLFAIDYTVRGATFHVLDVLHKEGRLDTWSTDCHLILLGGDQRRLLLAAGFEEVELFGSWAGEPYDAERSDRLIAVARKRIC